MAEYQIETTKVLHGFDYLVTDEDDRRVVGGYTPAMTHLGARWSAKKHLRQWERRQEKGPDRQVRRWRHRA